MQLRTGFNHIFTKIYSVDKNVFLYYTFNIINMIKDKKMAVQKNKNQYMNKSMKSIVNIQEIMHYIILRKPAGYVDSIEKHDFWELVYLESGEGVIRADDKLIPVFPGDIYFHKPYEAHGINAPTTPIKAFFISFHSDSRFMKNFENLKFSLDNEQKAILYKSYDEARNIFQNVQNSEFPFALTGLLDESKLGGQQLFKMYLETLLITIGRKLQNEEKKEALSSTERAERLIFQKTVEKIGENLYGKTTIEELCDELNYSRTYLSIIFKKYSDMSIMKYYNLLKIKEAKRLMRDTGYSISTISDMLHFNNQYYFSKVFKKYENISPLEYKKSLDS